MKLFEKKGEEKEDAVTLQVDAANPPNGVQSGDVEC